MKTNAILQQDVIAELSFEPSIDARNIGVVATDGVITLSGTVPTFPDKRGAEQAAERVRGVRAVADETSVDLPSLHRRNDQEIAAAAVNALSWQVTVPDDSIKVQVEEGWLTLDGSVEQEFQRHAALEAVRHLIGVRGVENCIAIKPLIDGTDLKVKIEDALKRSATLEAAAIEVSVTGNEVDLSGSVRSWTERNDADRAAWSASGVRTVNNNLKVVTE